MATLSGSLPSCALQSAIHQGGCPAHAHAHPAGPRLPTRGLCWLSAWPLPTLASYPKEGLPPRNECFVPLGQLPPVPGHPETRFRQVSSDLPTRTCFPPEARFPGLLSRAQSWSDYHILRLQGVLWIVCPGASLVTQRSPREATGLNDLPKEHRP